MDSQYPASSSSNGSVFIRFPKAGDNVVSLMKPLGLILNQDQNGNVYVERVAPKGNAARTGQVRNLTSAELHVDDQKNSLLER